jgi:hypothetical protein
VSIDWNLLVPRSRVAERSLRTLKEDLLWFRAFATLVELVKALRVLQRRYNEQCPIGRMPRDQTFGGQGEVP